MVSHGISMIVVPFFCHSSGPFQGECPVSPVSAGGAAALPGRLAAAGGDPGAAGGAGSGAEGRSVGAGDVGIATTQNAAG